jgi:drug/metabolite transporter (DMT)-like permease
MYTIFIALFVSFLSGCMPIFVKLILANIHVSTFMMILSFMTFLFSMGLAIFFSNHVQQDIGTIIQHITTTNIKKNTAVLCGMMAVFAFLSHVIFYSLLRNNVTFIVASIVACYPILTFLLSYIWLHEKVNSRQILAFFLILSGVLLFTNTGLK